MNSVQSFRAVLERGDRSLGWTVARVPFIPADVWPRMVRLRVRGEINGHAFRTSLFPETGRQNHFYLLVNRAMQRAAGVALGAAAEFRLEPDLADRPADLPDELDALLDEAEGLRAWYLQMSESRRRQLGKWLCEPASPEARARRAEDLAERLLITMEAETELPPLVAAALNANAKARAGWDRMTPNQRQGELLRVFGYKSPESRAKRLGKLVELAASKA